MKIRFNPPWLLYAVRAVSSFTFSRSDILGPSIAPILMGISSFIPSISNHEKRKPLAVSELERPLLAAAAS